MGLSPDAKERLGVVFEVAKTVFHWGFIPTVLYLGNKRKYIQYNLNVFMIFFFRIQKRSRAWYASIVCIKVIRNFRTYIISKYNVIFFIL